MRKIIGQIKVILIAEWEDCSSVNKILDVYYTHSVLKTHLVLSATPDLKDLLHGIGPNTKKLAERAETEKMSC